MRTQTPDRPYNVLFLCTGNSARSILAEALLNKIGNGKFRAYSAGSLPKGAVNPHALALLRRLGFEADQLRSKSWDEFAQDGAPHLDFVFTVCDNAANEVCPIWPGQPMTAHWGVPDPASVDGDTHKIQHAFREALATLQRRIELFANLPVASLDRMALKKRVDEIGQTAGARQDFVSRAAAAELVGTAFLLATVIGSGIMAQNLSGGNAALALLCNTLPTGAMLTVLILLFGPLSGAHFNPAVSLAFALRREMPWPNAAAHIICQFAGAVLGVWTAHLMFGLPLWEISGHVRSGAGQWFAEAIATFGLLLTILGCRTHNPSAVPYAVGLYITAAYWFTASTSFANPAVTLARSLSDSFAGIAPGNVPAFIVAQLVGMLAGMGLGGWLWPSQRLLRDEPQLL